MILKIALPIFNFLIILSSKFELPNEIIIFFFGFASYIIYFNIYKVYIEQL